MINHYEILGLESNADARQIKRAYFDLVREFPPERFPEKFKEIRAAYDALSDEGNRARYDEAAALPKDVAFLVSEAHKAKQQGRLEQVPGIYKIILDSHPELTAIRAEYAMSLEQVGKTGKATDEWEALCKQAPGNAVYLASLAYCYEMRGWRKRAIGAYIRVLEIDCGDIESWSSLVGCHLAGAEYEEVSRVSLQAVETLKQKGKESIYLYTCAATFGARGDPALTEGFLQDIVRFAQSGSLAVNEIRTSLLFLLQMFNNMNQTRFFPYIRQIADTIPNMESNLGNLIEKAELNYEASMLEDAGFSSLFCNLFEILNAESKDEDNMLDLLAMECNILAGLNIFRPQIIRLKNDYPQLFALHADFFNEAIRVKDIERLMHSRLKKLSKYGFSPTFDSGDNAEVPVQQTVRREGPKIGRNDPCPCGSGKKYKKCCGA